MFKLVDRETNNYLVFESNSIEEVQKELKNQEAEDKNNDCYEEDFYEIKEVLN